MIKKGETAFRSYYQDIFRNETESVLAALKEENHPVLLFNPKNREPLFELWQQKHLPTETLTWYPYALKWPQSISFGETLPGFQEKLIFPISASSLLPVIALNLKPSDHVLDACAAPGGKSLVIANHLTSPTQLHANDLSPDRVIRLKRTFKDHLYSSVSVTEMLAERLAIRHQNEFDKVLIDAPCSSEQHVVNSPKHLAQWSEKRIQSLQKRQLSLIESLATSVKSGGLLVYSTCAVTPEENELVVNSILNDNAIPLKLLPWPLANVPGGSGLPLPGLSFNPEWVHRVLPGRDEGDPMFVAVFQKT